MLGDTVGRHRLDGLSGGAACLHRLVDLHDGRPVSDDRDLAGEFGDRDRVVVAAPTAPAPADRRGADRAVLGQQFGHRDRSGAAVVVVWSSHRLLPLGLTRAVSRAGHGLQHPPPGLHQGGSVSFAVQFPQNQAFAQRPRANVHGVDSPAPACLPPPPMRPPRSVAPLGAHSFQFRSVRRGHPRDERYELAQAAGRQCPSSRAARPPRAPRR